MSDQPNEVDGRVGELETSLERLTSEVVSLKLELATLTSALRESEYQQGGRRLTLPANMGAPDPPSRPSMTPAAIIVLIAAGLLSWQVITTPGADRLKAQATRTAPTAPRAADRNALVAISPAIETATTEPPMTPLVKPTIYKGTLTVKANRPGARVFVNREDVGTAPVLVANLRAGAHLVWVESAGYRRWTRVVTVPAERVTRVDADLEPEPDPVVER